MPKAKTPEEYREELTKDMTELQKLYEVLEAMGHGSVQDAIKAIIERCYEDGVRDGLQYAADVADELGGKYALKS